ncbi:MAG TPA: hypothetical protein VL092_04525 [Chitinophagaceae bacterium]|nr:hypothetical protein [Chitinophagaceae bacterium]
MIAYNKTWLRHAGLVKKVKQWYDAGLLNEEQYDATVTKYPYNFYSPNLFVKIGLFLFTCIAVSATLGFYALLFMDAFEGEGFVTFTAFFFACATFGILEFLIRHTRIHHSGNDEALLYIALSAVAIGISGLFDYNFSTTNSTLLFCVLMSPVLLAAVIRYADRLVALVLSLFCYAIFFLLIKKTGPVAKLIMPFALMILSVPVYVYARKLKNQQRFFFWKECISVFETVALLVFYGAGNYYVIRESGAAFFGMVLKPGQDIPLAFFFYAFTAFIPLLYVFFGLKRKDKLLLWAGLLLIGIAVLTFKYYFSLGHTELTLTGAGSIMILVAYAAIRYLKTPKHGITFDEATDEEHFLKTNAEAIVLAQTFAHPGAAAEKNSGPDFGGGASGGGGAGGSF